MMRMKKRILIVDDDEVIQSSLYRMLCDEYEVLAAEDSDHAIGVIDEGIDLCLLDVNLKDEDGFSLCERIREISDVPIIFITVKDDEASLEKGILAGGDDYVTKPFSIHALKLRILAHIRRYSSLRNTKHRYYAKNDWVLDTVNHVFSFQNQPVPVSNVDFTIVEKLLSNAGCLVLRETLLDALADKNDAFVENNTLSVYISRLRKKMMKYNRDCPIETVSGVGYRWK